jgi:predicted nucleic acid-binding protein
VIAADTSSLVAYFAGDAGPDTDFVQAALADARLCISPIVLTELLSDPKTRDILEPIVSDWPLLEITQGYWQRASQSRARLIARKITPKLPDTLIAQSSIDHDIPLITRDADFRHFAKHCGLKLA